MINPKKLFTYIDSHFYISKSTNGWYTFDCCFCGKKDKMAVNFQYNLVKCWVCNYRNNGISFIADYEQVGYIDAKYKVQTCKESSIKLHNTVTINKGKVNLPFGYKRIKVGTSRIAKRARDYLIGRELDLEELDRLAVGYCDESDPVDAVDYMGYIILPFVNDNSLQYYIGRDFIGNYLRYKNPSKELVGVGKADLFWNEDALYLYDEVWLVEGVIDALTLGRDCISSQGWNLSRIQKNKLIKSSVERVVMVPDAGGGFYEEAIKLAIELLPHKEVKVINLNTEQGKDANEVGKHRIVDLYKNTGYLTYDKAVSLLL